MDENNFKDKNQKLDTDISKQICYEFCLKELYLEKIIKSQFVIPLYENCKDIGDFIEDKELYLRLQENKIEVFKANFQLIQDVYLSHD